MIDNLHLLYSKVSVDRFLKKKKKPIKKVNDEDWNVMSAVYRGCGFFLTTAITSVLLSSSVVLNSVIQPINPFKIKTRCVFLGSIYKGLHRLKR